MSDKDLLKISVKELDELQKGKPKPKRRKLDRKVAANLARQQLLEEKKKEVMSVYPKEWNSVSVRHKQTFKKLLKVWKKNPEKMTIIGVNGVCFQKEFFIGGGSCGTEVYICLGSDGVERAIKRFPIRYSHNLLQNERKILLSRNAVQSPRIVNYQFYDDTSNQDFAYLILNLYERNLKEYITEERESITEEKESITEERRKYEKYREMIRQVLEGLKALHGRNPRILHRDLKPTNILVDVVGDLVLSDFGIGRFLPEEGATHLTSNESGSKGWVAYECINWEGAFSASGNASDANIKLKWKEKSDIQVAGILAYYILTKGEHPFGSEVFYLQNMYNNVAVGLKKLVDPLVRDLLSQMLDRDLNKRPYVEQALIHPYFLSAKEKMKLVQAVGNEPEIKMVNGRCDVVRLLDNLGRPQPRSPLLPTDWKAMMDPDDLDVLCQGGRPPSSLTGGRYTHCLRLIRNVFQHWGDKRRPTLKDMGQGTCLEEYFLQLFPTLPVVLHQIIRDRHDWKTRPALEEFFPVITRRTGAS